MNPLLSVISINYNNAEGLRKTLSSLAHQTNKEFELILIDGASTDSSLQVANEFPGVIHKLISEKDKGIYDAQNKGIGLASGTFLLFLNSGDSLADENVIRDFADIANATSAGIIYGDTKLHNAKEEFQQDIHQPDPLFAYYFYKNTINHQSCFIRKKLFDEFGFYKTEYKVCSDYEFFLNVFLHRPYEYWHWRRYVANYYLGGFSSDPKNYDVVVKDKEKILSLYFSEKELKKFRKMELKEMGKVLSMKDRMYKSPFFYSLIKLYVRMKGESSAK